MQCFKIARRKLFNASVLKAELSADITGKPRSDVQIVIIGAGLAGLSAAHTLLKNGFTNTVLLEATDRLGGRICSQPFGDVYCELGAKWISMDGSRYSVYELLQEASKAGVRKKLHQTSGNCYVYADGANDDEQLHRRQVPERVELLFKQLCAGVELNQRFRTGGDLHSLNNVHTYFQAEADQTLKTIFPLAKEQALALDVFHSLCKQYSSLLGSCLEYVNIEHITTRTRATTGTDATAIYVPNGLNSLLQQIASEIECGHLKFGRPVGEIAWHSSEDSASVASKSSKRTVGCIDGSSFAADHIICTLPLGVLKNFSGYMFKPLLPLEKLSAIDNLGFGNPLKIYLEYKSSVQSWFSGRTIRPLWNASARKSGFKLPKQVVEISLLPMSSRVLEVFVGGAFYEVIEKLPDAEVVDEVTQLLRSCLKDEGVPLPSALLRSNWSSCACYLGGRPYFSVASSAHDVEKLAAPLGSALFFAGDATTLVGFGTLDGARRSGIREAQRIIKYYERLSM